MPAKLIVPALLAFLLLEQAAAAQSWEVSEEESVSLELMKPDKAASLLRIGCDSQNSEIAVPVPPPGHEPQQTAFDVALTGQDGGIRRLSLKPQICGGEITCTDRKNGMVSAYEYRQSGRKTALEIVGQAKSISVSLPDVAITAEADAKAFAAFTKLCKSWK